MVRWVMVIAALLAVYACSPTRGAAYADAYRDALQRIQGTTPVTPAMTEGFVSFFSHDRGEAAAPDPAALYGEPLYFSDTLLTTTSRGAVLEHLRSMRESARSIRVQLLDRQVDGQDAYLIWQMEAVLETPTGPISSNTVGVTHLRFDDTGRIILQQDFWDSAEGLYRHLPVLGSLINVVRGRFEPKTQ